MKPHPTLLALGAILLIAGCGGKSRPEAPSPQPTASEDGSGAGSAPDQGSGGPSAGDPAAETARRREAAARARVVLEQKVYFDFDRADLTAEARQRLNTKIEVLRDFPDVTLTIAGHADERGSDEYNLALGSRRAAAVKQFLVQHGLPAERWQTVSYGEEQPAISGRDESAWSQNRRTEFVVTAGLD